jgi:hypothetical protein
MGRAHSDWFLSSIVAIDRSSTASFKTTGRPSGDGKTARNGTVISDALLGTKKLA